MKTYAKMKLGLLVTLSIGLITLGPVGCRKPSKNHAPAAHEEVVDTSTPLPLITTVSFRLKWIVNSQFAHHLIAQEKGLYEKEGLSVTIRPGGAGLDPIKLVAAGDDLIGLGSPALILLAREKGIPVIALAEEHINNGSVVLSLPGSGITKPQDFIGKKVGWIPGSDTGSIYAALMAKLGIDRSKITEVPGGFDITPFLAGAVDVWTIAYITNQPIHARMRGVDVNIIDPRDYGITVGGNLFFTTEEKLAQHRSTIERFLRASIRAIHLAQEMSDKEVVDVVLKVNPKLDRSTEVDIWQGVKEHLLEKDPAKIGFLYKEKWEQTADVIHNYGSLETVPPLEECYTNQLVEKIHEEPGLF